MISIDNIIISSQYSQEYLLIDIRFKETYEDFSDYRINLLRSNNYDQKNMSYIQTDLVRFEHYDYDVNLLNKAVQYFYSVEIINKLTGETSVSSVYTSLQGNAEYYGGAISRLYSIYLNQIIRNPDIYILNKKETGQVCDVCYDSVRKRAQDPNCPVCSGTGFVEGYYPGIKTKINILNPELLSEEYTQKSVESNFSPLSAWTLNFPVLKIGDIVILSNNKRYVITNIQISKERSFVIRQSFQMSPIPASSNLYSLEVE